VHEAMESALSRHQREVVVAVTLQEVSIEVLAM
jgi:hypothetical protein